MAALQHKIDRIIKDDDTKYQKLSNILKLLVDFCKINKKSYMIIGSYCIREHREINDLDMNMLSKEWDKLKELEELGVGITETYNNQLRYFLDMTDEYNKKYPGTKDFSIEIFRKEATEGFPNDNFSLAYLIKHKGLDKDENKHYFFNKKTLLKWKKTMNREKDKPDIELLERLLKKGGRTIRIRRNSTRRNK